MAILFHTHKEVISR